MQVLAGKNIAKVYGGREKNPSTNALRDIDIRIDRGEFVGIMGPSGSGKTTLLNILSGIDTPTSGSVFLGETSLHTMKPDELALFRRKAMGYVFQEFNLLDSLSINENIMLPLVLDKKDPNSSKKRVDQLVKTFDIEGIAGKYPCEVSGGQQQRAAVARAIVNNPSIVFADEPTGNLDSRSSKAVMESFEKMNAAENVTVMMVTHDPFAASYCKRIIFIRDGAVHHEIIRRGDRKEFFEKILDCLAVVGGEQNEI